MFNPNTDDKRVCWFITIAAMLFLLTGCGTGDIFDGSRVSNASEFQMVLQAGEQLRVALSHTEGTVDVTVGMEGQEPIYRGNGQQNADFVLEIPETGNYRISVSGHQAKGKVSFIRIPGEQE